MSCDVSVIPNDFNVLTIISLIDSGVIAFPTFQRNYIWDRKRASLFIESLILGLPVPQVFLHQTERNKYSVIDGQHRLLTIYFFAKQHFPKSCKRNFLRKVFDKKGHISDDVLADNNYFQDFALKLAKQENGAPHPLNNKKYHTLGVLQRQAFNLVPIRCMAVRQNNPDDAGTIYEIYSRLNTGGASLSPQEIRGCLYASPFYDMLYELNSSQQWRALVGRDNEDDRFRDVEILLRSFALLYEGKNYNGSMTQFLNRFSKNAQKFDANEVDKCRHIFEGFLTVCKAVGQNEFIAKTGNFNAALFDAVFVAVAERILSFGIEKSWISTDLFNNLKSDSDFRSAITSNASSCSSIKRGIALARKHLYGAAPEGK